MILPPQVLIGFRQLENHLAFSHHCFLTPDAVRAQEAGVEPDAVCGGVPAAGAGAVLVSSFQGSRGRRCMTYRELYRVALSVVEQVLMNVLHEVRQKVLEMPLFLREFLSFKNFLRQKGGKAHFYLGLFSA